MNAGFNIDALTFVGELADYVSTADSGNVMHRRFCPRCGTHLFSAAEARPHLVFVRVGSLDDPGAVSPQSSIWTESAPHWASIDRSLPCIAGQPPQIG